MAEKSGVDGAAPETALNESDGAIGLSDLTAMMTPAEATEEVVEEGLEEEIQQEEEGEEIPDSVLERYGLSDLTEDERLELNRELGGKAAERFGEFTAKNRALEAEVRALRGELDKREGLTAKVDNNPYAEKATMEELEEVYSSALDTIDRGEEALEDNGDASEDEEILELSDGRNLTKREVRAMVRNARKARDVFVPARQREIEKTLRYESAREQKLAEVRKVHPWIDDGENPLKGAYEKVVATIAEQARKVLPELLPDVDMMIADYLAAEQTRRNGSGKAARKTVTPKRQAPDTHVGTGAPSSRPAARDKKRRQDKLDRFLSTRGSQSDVAALFMP